MTASAKSFVICASNVTQKNRTPPVRIEAPILLVVVPVLVIENKFTEDADEKEAEDDGKNFISVPAPGAERRRCAGRNGPSVSRAPPPARRASPPCFARAE